MNILLLVTTLTAFNGHVIPDTEAVSVATMGECVTLSAEIHHMARKDGRKVFTTCTAPRKLEDYR